MWEKELLEKNRRESRFYRDGQAGKARRVERATWHFGIPPRKATNSPDNRVPEGILKDVLGRSAGKTPERESTPP
jgi:hypothetical protein